MSTVNDPLTQGINALTTYANSVTGESDTNLSDAVYSLVQGYGQGSGSNLLDYARTFENLFNGATNLPPTIELNADSLATGNKFASSFYHAYEDGENSATIDLTVHFPSDNAVQTSLYRGFFQAYGLKSVTIDGDLSNITSYAGTFDYCRNIEAINVTFDFSSCTNQGDVNFFNNGANTILTTLRFVPNTLAYSLKLSGFRALDADSLISVANCLRSDVTEQTLTLYSTQTTMCSSITGTVTNGTFTADESGSVTLADFITNTKGWTLASA